MNTGATHPLLVGRVIPASGAYAAASEPTQGASGASPQVARDLGGVNSYRSAINIVAAGEGVNLFRAASVLERGICIQVEKLLKVSKSDTKDHVASQVCVTTLRNNLPSQVSVKSEESRVVSDRVKSAESRPWSSEALYNVKEESEDGQHDIEQSEFRWMQSFFVRGYTLAEALIEIKQLPKVQAQFRKLSQEESVAKDKNLMRKLIRARDSAANFNEIIDEVKEMPLEALPLPAFDEDTRRAAALFELRAKRSRKKSLPTPMSAVAHLLDCAKEEARRTIRDLLSIPFIKQARKGKGSQANCYKLESDDDEESIF